MLKCPINPLWAFREIWCDYCVASRHDPLLWQRQHQLW